MRKLLSMIAALLSLLPPASAQLMMTGVGGSGPGGGKCNRYYGERGYDIWWIYEH
jgi:hypothetical protein